MSANVDEVDGLEADLLAIWAAVVNAECPEQELDEDA